LSAPVGPAGSIYIAGAVTGSLFFGYLTDRLGRKEFGRAIRTARWTVTRRRRD
jgi:MFS family permease